MNGVCVRNWGNCKFDQPESVIPWSNIFRRHLENLSVYDFYPAANPRDLIFLQLSLSPAVDWTIELNQNSIYMHSWQYRIWDKCNPWRLEWSVKLYCILYLFVQLSAAHECVSAARLPSNKHAGSMYLGLQNIKRALSPPPPPPERVPH